MQALCEGTLLLVLIYSDIYCCFGKAFFYFSALAPIQFDLVLFIPIMLFTVTLGMFSRVIQQIKMYGKIKEWVNCLLNAKKVSARLPRNLNLPLLFEMRFVNVTFFLMLIYTTIIQGVDVSNL